VRQLENAVERGVVLCQGETFDVDLLPTEVLSPQVMPPAQVSGDGVDLREAVNQYTRALIEASLARCGGVQRRAAAMLKVRPSTLNEMIRRLGVAPTEE
jgi:DNA-binding NtrC family response regulator